MKGCSRLATKSSLVLYSVTVHVYLQQRLYSRHLIAREREDLAMDQEGTRCPALSMQTTYNHL